MNRTFIIKKRIEARDMNEAIKRERQAVITDIWAETITSDAIGFKVL